MSTWSVNTATGNITTTTSMEIDNGTCNLLFPTENPTGASPTVPFALSKTSDGGPLVWSPVSGGNPSSGFNAMLLYTNYVDGSYALTLNEMFPDVPGGYEGSLLLEVTMIGGGGSGSSLYNPASSSGCGGGGGGATSIKYLRSPVISISSSFALTVGSGGAAATGGNVVNSGNDGGTTLFALGGTVYGARGGGGAGTAAVTPDSVNLVLGGNGGALGLPGGANTASDFNIAGSGGGSGVYNAATAAGYGGATTMSGSARGPIQLVASTNYAGFRGIAPGGGGTGSWQNINSTASTASGAGAAGGIIAKLWYNAE